MSLEIKSTSYELEARVEAINHELDSKHASQKKEIRVQNIEFHKLQKFLFSLVSNVKLKPRTKVLKCLFHKMALKNLYVTTILLSCFSSRET